jgi:hypothetical protein
VLERGELPKGRTKMGELRLSDRQEISAWGLANAHDRGKVSDHSIADHLAKIDYGFTGRSVTVVSDRGALWSGAGVQMLGQAPPEPGTSSTPASSVIGSRLRSPRSRTVWTCRRSSLY